MNVWFVNHYEPEKKKQLSNQNYLTTTPHPQIPTYCWNLFRETVSVGVFQPKRPLKHLPQTSVIWDRWLSSCFGEQRFQILSEDQSYKMQPQTAAEEKRN